MQEKSPQSSAIYFLAAADLDSQALSFLLSLLIGVCVCVCVGDRGEKNGQMAPARGQTQRMEGTNGGQPRATAELWWCGLYLRVLGQGGHMSVLTIMIREGWGGETHWRWVRCPRTGLAISGLSPAFLGLGFLS